jgi:hypothetical protein
VIRPHGGPAARAGGDDVVYGPRDCRSASYACIPAFGMEILFMMMADGSQPQLVRKFALSVHSRPSADILKMGPLKVM